MAVRRGARPGGFALAGRSHLHAPRPVCWLVHDARCFLLGHIPSTAPFPRPHLGPMSRASFDSRSPSESTPPLPEVPTPVRALDDGAESGADAEG
jgi:hypothetical protein